MKHLKIWQKLALMGIVFMIPFAVVTYKMVSSINTLGVEFARHEIRGLDYYIPLLALLKDLQQHRSMASAWLNGDAAFTDNLATKVADIEDDIAKVDAVDQRLDSALHTSKEWTALRAACSDLMSKTRGLSADDSFQQHTSVIGKTIALIAHVGDASNLTLDPDIDSYYLMNVLVFQGPELSDLLAQASGLGIGMAAAKGGTVEQFERLDRLSVLVGFLENNVKESLSKALAFNPGLESQLEAHVHASDSAVQAAAGDIGRLASNRNVSGADYYPSISRSIDSIFEMEGHVAGALNELLIQRIGKFQHEVRYTLAWAALGLLVVSLISLFIMRDITVPLSKLVASANQIATGDLTVQAESEARKDEIGVLGQAFANMIGSLSTLVGEVHKSGIQINTSVTEISATAKQQQATASEIAATTTEIGATSKEISATSKELVKTMIEVSGVTEQSATLAGSGQAGLTHMEDTMRHVMEAAGSINAKLAVLNEKAGNINQVVTTITKVADQTNLLSLNAAIEAEKAGEYGRGFAVVATEIRRLADQTAVATYDIEQMVKEILSAVSAGVMGMDKFSEEVRRGIEEVQQVGNQLSQIIQQVQALAPRVESVNEGMQAQATGAEQITQALGQLSEAAQQTVESLSQSSLAIGDLNQVSTGLRNGVSRFRLQEA